MAKAKDATVKVHAEMSALAEYRKALGDRPAVPIEEDPAHGPDGDVARYWAVELKPGEVRACIVYSFPGRGGALFVGKDGSREEVARWLSSHGIPTVKLGKTIRS